MKKIILLSTAAMLLSPLAAKAGQKSSIIVAATGTLERVMSSSSNATTKSIVEQHEGENFLAFGAEGYYTYKVYGDVVVAGGLRALYAPEHKFEESKGAANLVAGFVVEPRVTVGYEFAVAQNFSVTPYAGLGVEFNIDQEKTTAGKEEWKTHTKLILPVGARMTYANFFANVNARFDVTATDLPKSTFSTEVPSVRNWGVEISLGAEF